MIGTKLKIKAMLNKLLVKIRVPQRKSMLYKELKLLVKGLNAKVGYI